MSKRQVMIFIACSVDGYIATKDDDISWLDMVDREGEDYGYFDFIKNVDTVLLGRKTYDKVLTLSDTFWHKDRKTIVLSNSKTGSDDNVTFFNGPITELISDLQKQEGKTIFCDGGSEIIFELMKHDLIDRFIISVIPIFLGDGVSLFKPGRHIQRLELKRSMTFPSGLVQLWYEKVKSENAL